MTKFDKERQQLAINYWKRVCEGANHYHKRQVTDAEQSRPNKNANTNQIDNSTE